MNRQPARGFAYIELLIIACMVMAIVMVVAPCFQSSPDSSTQATAEFHLGTLRAVVRAFREDHGGQAPELPNGSVTIDELTTTSTLSKSVDGTTDRRAYLSEMPVNPFTGASVVKAAVHVPPTASDVSPNSNGGWIYDPSSGNFWLDSNIQGEFAW